MHIPPLDVSPYPIVTMSHGRYENSARSRTPLSSANHSPDFSNIQKLVRSVFRSQRLSILQIERMPSRLHQVYLLRITDGSSLFLKCPPLFNTRLLRHEQRTLQGEAKVLDALSSNTQLRSPECIDHDPQGRALGSPHLLLQCVPGTRLSDLSSRLTASERRTVDRTIGAYVRSITSLAADSFGLAHRVFAGTGSTSWRQAFLYLLEAALRDAEDMVVSVPYDSIRQSMARHGRLLDEVTEARLVPLDVGIPENVLVDDRTKQVSGVVGFSNAVWGDPMLAAVFVNASDAFFEGYGECPSPVGKARIRQLLYTVYRSLVAVVEHHYRPNYASGELDARGSLTWALSQLSQL
ncbi:uncharacterized protein BDZ99DRAFT_379646 [Mytilinidion resinicola]|uniref:Aminoglycoside phosphotransferase domain-containing protein n=1 Tax=Mytilinidion resinicola TaxID=574789 RepID=A0A6A6YZJ7_9PEZI|nr:uncharacterized protein BDZ99DRAFT_379646 [Mytilinidion resinicola]KAF2813958.1 hypothetical protein BDZ99DRAFT_379646 [Mytilinidion resinicola]